MKNKILILLVFLLLLILKPYIDINNSNDKNFLSSFSLGYVGCGPGNHTYSETKYSNNRNGTHQVWKECLTCGTRFAERTYSHGYASYNNWTCLCGATYCSTCGHDCDYQCNSSCTCCCSSGNTCSSGHTWVNQYRNNKNGTHYVWNECTVCGRKTTEILYNGHGYQASNNWTCRCGAVYCPTCGHDCDYQCSDSCTCCCGSGEVTYDQCYCGACYSSNYNACACLSRVLCNTCNKCSTHCTCNNICPCIVCGQTTSSCSCSSTICSTCGKCTIHCGGHTLTDPCYCTACLATYYPNCSCGGRELCVECNKCSAHCPGHQPSVNYTLTINPNGGSISGSTSNLTISRTSGSTVTVNTPIPPIGYTVIFNPNEGTINETSLTSTNSFYSWTLAGVGSINNTIYTFGSGDATLTANYVTNAITLPTPQRTGYVFTGWYTAMVGGTKIGDANESYTPLSNITVYARWEEETSNEYTLTVNPNGGTWNGSNLTSNILGTSGSTTTVTDPISGVGHTVTYNANGGTVGTSSDISLKVFSGWSKVGYGSLEGTIYTYGSGNGELIANYDENAVTLPAPTKNGSIFKGWYTALSGGTEIGGAGDLYTPVSNITLYAQWEAGPSQTVTLTINPNGGTYNGSTSTSTVSGLYGDTTEVSNPIAPLGNTITFDVGGGIIEENQVTQTKIFIGWSKTGGGGINGSTYAFGNENGTLTAAYLGAAVTLPTPTRGDYIFKGWYTSIDGNDKIGDAGSSYIPAYDITLYAQWKLPTYIINVSQGSNGRVFPSGIVEVNKGATQEFYIIPDSGYKVSSITIDSVNIGAKEKYKLTDITANHVINVNFAAAEAAPDINKPIISENMIPIRWNEDKWEITGADDYRWYNYNNNVGKWANVMLRDGAKYINDNGVVTDVGITPLANLIGREIDNNNIGSVYVWVPRYSYKINNQSIDIKWSSGLTDYTLDNYILHPAFNYAGYKGGDTSTESNYSSDGNNLTGIWIAKYEAKNVNSKIRINSSGNRWTNTDIGTMFTTAKNMVNVSDYLLSSVNFESHMLKSSEWGAIAYLQKYATGAANLNEHNIKEINKVTGNGEYVAGYHELVGGTVNYNVRLYGNSLKQAAGRFVDIVIIKLPYDDSRNYSSYKNYYGNAIGETSSSGSGDTSFDNESSIIPEGSSPFTVRNGRFGYTNGTGAANSLIGFRTAISVIQEPVITKRNVSVQSILNGGTITGINSYTPGETVTLTVSPSNGYKFNGWAVIAGGITIPNAVATTITFTMPNNDVYLIVDFELSSFANAPVLVPGMTPVKWNEVSNNWVETTENDPEWYSYESVAEASQNNVAGNGAGKWANVKLNDGSMFVWIPRYSYKIINGANASGNSWNSLESAGSNKIEIKWSNGIFDNIENGYIAHPAFNYATYKGGNTSITSNYNVSSTGGTVSLTDENKLTGIWVAKYEASRSDATSSSGGSSEILAVKPNVVSLRNINIDSMFTYSKNMLTINNATYGIANERTVLDSHMMKNSEWGAVAYLTNAIGRIPYINNNSNYITGMAGNSQNAASSSSSNLWNTANGVKASTTHNVYGIYDLSGGAYEYTASYVANGSTYITSYGLPLTLNENSPIVERYTITGTDSRANNYNELSNYYGLAMNEVSSSYENSTSWDGDSSYCATGYGAFVIRGGTQGNEATAGIFNFDNYRGLGDANSGFRPVIAINSVEAPKYTLTTQVENVEEVSSKYKGQNVTLTVIPDEGYTFTGWTTTGITLPNTSVVTFIMPANSVRIVANFEPSS